MDFDWLWKGLLSNWIADLLVLGVGAIIAYLKLKTSKWATPIVYGICASALTALLFYAVDVRHKFVTEQRAITSTENIQERIRIWIDNFGLTNQSIPDDALYFRYVVTMQNKNKIIISREKKQAHYVTLQAQLLPTSVEEPLLTKLSKTQVEELFNQLRIEAARQKMSFTIIDQEHKSVTLLKYIPIGVTLTEDVLIGGIDDMDCALVILQENYKATLRHNKLLQ